MTGFFIAAAVMVAVALAFLVPPLMRGVSGGPSRAGPSRRDVGVAVHRERLRELEVERDAGEIDAEAFAAARDELDRELLEELGTLDEARPAPPRARPWAAVSVAVALPLAAAGVYLAVGSPDLLVPGARTAPPAVAGARTAPPEAAGGAPPLEDMVARVEQRLREHPDDARGWLVLGRTYQLMGRLEEARAALAKALALTPDHPEALVSQAETLASLAGGDLSGEPVRLVERALAVTPDMPRALWLAGVHAYNTGDSDAAVAWWRKTLAVPGLDAGSREQIRAAIADAGGTAEAEGQAPAAAASVRVEVSLAPELVGRITGGEALFVFARAPAGPPMPLAVKRFTADRLPLTVTLDESDAMAPELSMAGAEEVVITARISRSGDPVAASGDLQGESAPVATRGAHPVRVVVDRVIP